MQREANLAPRSVLDASIDMEALRSFDKTNDWDCPLRNNRDDRNHPRRGMAGQTRTKVVEIEDYDFSLRAISVFVGDTIEFLLSPNVPGHVEHVLEGRCAVRPELDFVSGVLQRPDSTSYRYRPESEGEVCVRCQVYTDMMCRIYVVSWSAFHRLSTFMASNSHRIAPCTRLNGDVRPYKPTKQLLSDASVDRGTVWGGGEGEAVPAISLWRDWSECSGSEAPQSAIDSDDQLSVATASSKTRGVAVPLYDTTSNPDTRSGSDPKCGAALALSNDVNTTDHTISIMNNQQSRAKYSLLYASPSRFPESASDESSSPFVRSVIAKDLEFIPSQLSIDQGSTVEFICKAATSSLSISCDDEFEMITIGMGVSTKFRHTFNYPGNFCVRNEIFRFMKCDIYVSPKVVKATQKLAFLVPPEGGENLRGEYRGSKHKKGNRPPLAALDSPAKKRTKPGVRSTSSLTCSNEHISNITPIRNELVFSSSRVPHFADEFAKAMTNDDRNEAAHSDGDDSMSSVSGASDEGEDADQEDALNDVKLRLQKYKLDSQRPDSMVPKRSVRSVPGEKQKSIDDKLDGDYDTLSRRLNKAASSPPLMGSFWTNSSQRLEGEGPISAMGNNHVGKIDRVPAHVSSSRPLFGSFLSPHRSSPPVQPAVVVEIPDSSEALFDSPVESNVAPPAPPPKLSSSSSAKRRNRRKQASILNKSVEAYDKSDASALELQSIEKTEPVAASMVGFVEDIATPLMMGDALEYNSSLVVVGSNDVYTVSTIDLSAASGVAVTVHAEHGSGLCSEAPCYREDAKVEGTTTAHRDENKSANTIISPQQKRRKRERKSKIDTSSLPASSVVVMPTVSDSPTEHLDHDVRFNFFAEESVTHVSKNWEATPNAESLLIFGANDPIESYLDSSDPIASESNSVSKGDFDVISALRVASQRRRDSAMQRSESYEVVEDPQTCRRSIGPSMCEEIESFLSNRWVEVSNRYKSVGTDVLYRDLEVCIVEYELQPSFCCNDSDSLHAPIEPHIDSKCLPIEGTAKESKSARKHRINSRKKISKPTL